MSTLVVEDVTLRGMSLVNAFVNTKSAQFPKDKLRADLLYAASTSGAGENGVRMHIVMLNKKNGIVVSSCRGVCYTYSYKLALPHAKDRSARKLKRSYH